MSFFIKLHTYKKTRSLYLERSSLPSISLAACLTALQKTLNAIEKIVIEQGIQRCVILEKRTENQAALTPYQSLAQGVFFVQETALESCPELRKNTHLSSTFVTNCLQNLRHILSIPEPCTPPSSPKPSSAERSRALPPLLHEYVTLSFDVASKRFGISIKNFMRTLSSYKTFLESIPSLLKCTDYHLRIEIPELTHIDPHDPLKICKLLYAIVCRNAYYAALEFPTETSVLQQLTQNTLNIIHRECCFIEQQQKPFPQEHSAALTQFLIPLNSSPRPLSIPIQQGFIWWSLWPTPSANNTWRLKQNIFLHLKKECPLQFSHLQQIPSESLSAAQKIIENSSSSFTFQCPDRFLCEKYGECLNKPLSKQQALSVLLQLIQLNRSSMDHFMQQRPLEQASASQYLLITNSMQSVINQLFASITSHLSFPRTLALPVVKRSEELSKKPIPTSGPLKRPLQEEKTPSTKKASGTSSLQAPAAKILKTSAPFHPRVIAAQNRLHNVYAFEYATPIISFSSRHFTLSTKNYIKDPFRYLLFLEKVPELLDCTNYTLKVHIPEIAYLDPRDPISICKAIYAIVCRNYHYVCLELPLCSKDPYKEATDETLDLIHRRYCQLTGKEKPYPKKHRKALTKFIIPETSAPKPLSIPPQYGFEWWSVWPKTAGANTWRLKKNFYTHDNQTPAHTTLLQNAISLLPQRFAQILLHISSMSFSKITLLCSDSTLKERYGEHLNTPLSQQQVLSFLIQLMQFNKTQMLAYFKERPAEIPLPHYNSSLATINSFVDKLILTGRSLNIQLTSTTEGSEQEEQPLPLERSQIIPSLPNNFTLSPFEYIHIAVKDETLLSITPTQLYPNTSLYSRFSHLVQQVPSLLQFKRYTLNMTIPELAALDPQDPLAICKILYAIICRNSYITQLSSNVTKKSALKNKTTFALQMVHNHYCLLTGKEKPYPTEHDQILKNFIIKKSSPPAPVSFSAEQGFIWWSFIASAEEPYTFILKSRICANTPLISSYLKHILKYTKTETERALSFIESSDEMVFICPDQSLSGNLREDLDKPLSQQQAIAFIKQLLQINKINAFSYFYKKSAGKPFNPICIKILFNFDNYIEKTAAKEALLTASTNQESSTILEKAKGIVKPIPLPSSDNEDSDDEIEKAIQPLYSDQIPLPISPETFFQSQELPPESGCMTFAEFLKQKLPENFSTESFSFNYVSLSIAPTVQHCNISVREFMENNSRFKLFVQQIPHMLSCNGVNFLADLPEFPSELIQNNDARLLCKALYSAVSRNAFFIQQQPSIRKAFIQSLAKEALNTINTHYCHILSSIEKASVAADNDNHHQDLTHFAVQQTHPPQPIIIPPKNSFYWWHLIANSSNPLQCKIISKKHLQTRAAKELPGIKEIMTNFITRCNNLIKFARAGTKITFSCPKESFPDAEDLLNTDLDLKQTTLLLKRVLIRNQSYLISWFLLKTNVDASVNQRMNALLQDLTTCLEELERCCDPKDV